MLQCTHMQVLHSIGRNYSRTQTPCSGVGFGKKYAMCFMYSSSMQMIQPKVVGMDLENYDVFTYNFALQGGYLDKYICNNNNKKK